MRRIFHCTVAFVTLRGGSWCGNNNENVLLTISVANPKMPRLLQTDTVVTPYGLAVRDSLLYIANENAGFTLFRIESDTNPEPVKSWMLPHSKDFIWKNDILFVMGFDRIDIMKVTDPYEPVLISTIR